MSSSSALLMCEILIEPEMERGMYRHLLNLFIQCGIALLFRMATAPGKQGIWFLLCPDRENTGNFALTQGNNLKHRENIFL